MLGTAKDLILALINATLILIALCLFLAWKVADAADQIATNFAQSLVTIDPVRADIQSATTELAALRGDIAKISAQTGTLRSASLTRIEARLAEMDNRMTGARDSLANLSRMPEQLIDNAVDSATSSLKTTAESFRHCEAD